MPQRGRTLAAAGFTLLPVVLAMSLVAAIAFLLNRDNGVNANLIGTQADRERARYAAEAGLQAVNYAIQIQTNPCTGGYPISIPDTSFGGASYSATADKPPGSTTLTLTSKGSYNGASVTLTKTNAYVYQSGIRTWVTQPDLVATGKETYVWSDPASQNKNYGRSTHLFLDKDGQEILLQFDLSPLPAGSRVVPWYDLVFGLQPGAIASLYQNPNNFGYSQKAFLVRLITQSWVAGTQVGGSPANGATWNTYDGVNRWPSSGVGYGPRELNSVPEDPWGWLNMDITNAALAWMSGVPGPAPTYVSATSFTVAGDQTRNGFEVGRRIKTVNSGGTIYSTISSSVFSALTTVTVINDAGTLNSGLSEVSGLVYPNYGVWLDPNNQAKNYDFYSSNYGGDPCVPCFRPKLTVNYLLPCGKTAPPSA